MKQQPRFNTFALAFLLVLSACQKSFDVPANTGTDNTSTQTSSDPNYAWELMTMTYPGLKDYEAGSFVIGTRAYVLDVQGHLWSLESGANSWVRKADLPFRNPPDPNGYFLLFYPIVFSVGDKGYVTCGHWSFQNIGIIDQGSSTTVWEYDASKDFWTVRADFAGTPRIMPVAVPGADFALVGLGISQKQPISTASEFLRYTPASDHWSTAPDCSKNIIQGTGFLSDGNSYLIGDEPVAGSTSGHDNRLFKFTSDNWQELASVGNARDWFTFATPYARKAFAVSTSDNASTLVSFDLSSGATARHSALPVAYSPGGTSFIFRLGGTLYLGDLLQKKIWTCKLG